MVAPKGSGVVKVIEAVLPAAGGSTTMPAPTGSSVRPTNVSKVEQLKIAVYKTIPSDIAILEVQIFCISSLIVRMHSIFPKD